MGSSSHQWRFFRAGGFDQVRLDRGADLVHLEELDQTLWMALACPTRGLEFDSATLDLIDADKDGRIRAPEIIAAVKWAVSVLKDPDELVNPAPALALSAINDTTPEGQQLRAASRQILAELGKADAAQISVDDTTDTTKIFAQTRFNGDGVIPVDSADGADGPAIQAVLQDIITTLGAEKDRSGKPGINQAQADEFFKQAQALLDWHNLSTSDAKILPLGDKTAAAAAAIKALRTKIDDYFARCRLAAFDARAIPALNRDEKEFALLAAKDLSLAAAEIASLPLARIEPGRPLPLREQINPAWAAAVETLRTAAVLPLLGERAVLTEAEWTALVGTFGPYETWNAAKPATKVESLGLERLRTILASNAQKTINDLLARDKALEAEFNAIASVDKLVRFKRDLWKLLNNYVNFRDFYTRKDRAVFQAGRLYLDQRACDLCVRVDDSAKHGLMAHLSQSYLAYLDCTRKSSGEKMTIAAAFTAGDSDNLMVGRNGVFYDRKGNDWDATITKIVDNPISIRQAFWLPYKKLARFIGDQIAKRAAAAEAASQARLQQAAVESGHAAVSGKSPPPPAPAARVDVGVVAAMGVALGALTAAFGTFMAWLTNVPGYYIPFYVLLLLLVISTPSVILAWLKLRQRNLGPLLDANGWAVNAKAKINLPFGRSLTHARVLPPGSQRDLFDPYAEKNRGRWITLLVVLLALVAWGCWYFGAIERVAPNLLPKSGYLQRKEAAAQKSATTAPTTQTATTAPATQSATRP